MVYQLHNSLLFFSSTLLMSILRLYFTQPSLSLQVFAEEDSKNLNVKQANLQQSNVNVGFTMKTTASTSINNTNPKTTTTANTTATGNIVEKLSDKGMYRVQLRSNESFSFLPKNGFNMQMLFLNASSTSAEFTNTTSQMKQLIPVNGFMAKDKSNNKCSNSI